MIDSREILIARNRNRVQRKVYLHEAESNMSQSLSQKIIGKKSASLFAWACVVYVQHLLGCKHDYLSPEDRLILNNLHRAISLRT
jgi:hypothetical protein